MLRWCLSTVRVSDGRSGLSLNILRSSSTIRLPAQLTNPSRTWPMYDVQPAAFVLSGCVVAEQASTAVSLAQEQPELSNAQSMVMSAAPRDNVTKRPDSRTAGVEDSMASPRRPSNCTTPATIVPPVGNALPIRQLEPLLFMTFTDLLCMDQPIPTANTIRSLYQLSKARSRMRGLSPDLMSSLISLFGTLSLSTAGRVYDSVHSHPLAKHILEKTQPRAYWSFIGQLMKDKRRTNMKLSTADQFWMMHVLLGHLRGVGSENGSYKPSAQVLQEARIHYRQIRKTSTSPDIHIPYLEGLIGLSSEASQVELVDSFRWLIVNYPFMHPRLLGYFWQTVLQSSHQLSPNSRAGILDALASRAGLRLEKLELSSNPAPLLVQNPGPEDFFQIEDLVSALTDSVSGLDDSGSSAILRRWSLQTASVALRPQAVDGTYLDVAWARLGLLAMCNSTITASKLITLPSMDVGSSSLDWEAICVLVQLERLLHGRSGRMFSPFPCPPEQAMISEVTHTIWDRWSTTGRDKSSSMSLADPAILGSFLYIAGRTRDLHLYDACSEYIGRLLQSYPETSLSHGYLRQILGEQLIASLFCGYQPRYALHFVLGRANDVRLRANIVHGALRRIITSDALLAQGLATAAQQAGVDVSPDMVAGMARELACVGAIDLALSYASDNALTTYQRTEVVEALLRLFTRQPLQTHPQHFHDSLRNSVVNLLPYTTSLSFYDTLGQAIVAMLKNGLVPLATAILKALLKTGRVMLKPSITRVIVRLLVRHRQFRLATSLFESLGPGSANNRFNADIVFGLARGKAHRLAWRLSAPLYRSQKISTALFDAVRSRYHDPFTASMLRLQRVMSRKVIHESAVRAGFHVMLQARRIRAARLVFSQIHKNLTPEARTAVGNDIVHSSLMLPLRRERHRIKSALHVLKDLSTHCQFVPDRVTMNILVKGLLRWRQELDANGVRALFDRLILSGYPVGSLLPPGVTPFGTNASGHPPMALPKVNSPILFEKHVRPLYKMFIKGLFLRQDVYGARKIVGILKAVEAQQTVE